MSRFSQNMELVGSRTLIDRPRWDGHMLTMGRALELLATDVEFRSSLLATLREAPFQAYFWEHPAIDIQNAGREFEYALTDAPAFNGVTAERKAFHAYFSNDGEDVATFQNLSGDATLVVPCPRDSTANYAHLAAFVRSGPIAQQHALLEAVGRAALARLSRKPMWLSTAGLGVYWLHVRIDDRPKYYRHRAYTASPNAPSDRG